MILLTVNTRIAPVFGTKFKPLNQNNINLQTLNTISPNNLSGMPKEDTFTKKSNVSFTGLNEYIMIGRCDPPEYNTEYKKALQEKFDDLWDWAQKQEKYAPYFEKINIEKPKLHITEVKDKFIHFRDPLPYEAAAYLWMDNSIGINRSFAPNMVLVKKGKMGLGPQIQAIRNTKSVQQYQESLEMLCGSNLEATTRISRANDEVYFRKLSPEEAAEVAVPYLAHLLDHVIIGHILFNTAGLKTSYVSPEMKTGNFSFEKAVYKLKEEQLYPKDMKPYWEETYPYLYMAKDPEHPAFDKDDIWELDTKDGFVRRFRLEDVHPMFFTRAEDHLTNYLDLAGQCAALEYLEQYTPKKFGNKDIDNMMYSLMEYQKQTLRDDIETRKQAIQKMEAKAQKKKKKGWFS